MSEKLRELEALISQIEALMPGGELSEFLSAEVNRQVRRMSERQAEISTEMKLEIRDID